MSQYHPELEKLVDVFVSRTGNPSRHFFRVQISFFLGLVSSTMRTNVIGWGSSKIPTNIYAVNLSPSGAGKGYSLSVIENQVLKSFKEIFREETFLTSALMNMVAIASKRAAQKGTGDSEELEKLEKEFEQLGSYLLNFDSATPSAVKQLRHKIQIANAGALNLIVDEIGANLLGQQDALTLFLELYDVGRTNEKLIKSTTENLRTARFDTPTPANMLLFGEPTSLFDGGLTEKKFTDMLSMGYARRCIFGFTQTIEKDLSTNPEEMLNRMLSASSDQVIEDLDAHFAILSDVVNLNSCIKIERPEALSLMTYKISCEHQAAQFGDHETTRKAEMEHRYFKVLKLAGAYAFFDQALTITGSHLQYAISLVEDSGKHFSELITPVKPYVRLAKYLAQMHPQELTSADLDQNLTFLPKSKVARDEMFMMAAAWGYKNCHVVYKSMVNNITFYSGKTITPTDLDKMIISVSQDMTTGYTSYTVPFSKLDQLAVNSLQLHWLNHHLDGGYRDDSHIKTGFNMIVFDVDNGCTLKVAQAVLSDYTYLMYTTKSHVAGVNERFRIVLPINYLLHLSAEDYKKMLQTISNDLPLIKMDEDANHRVKKWLNNPSGTVYSNTGKLFDVLPYIPNTTKYEERKKHYEHYGDLSALERWTIENAQEGSRNTTLYRFAMVLVDLGKSLQDITESVTRVNQKLQNPLEDAELHNTVLLSVRNAVTP